MRDSGQALSQVDIEELEKEIGAKFPGDYKNFLATYNGGRPTPKRFMVDGFDDEPRQVLDFFGLYDQVESCNIDWNYRILSARISGLFVPIACEDSGNIVYISLLTSSYGNVFYWLHDFAMDAKSDASYFVAESFSEFLNKLRD